MCALKPDYTLQSLNAWDTLGMRGTCSNGFRVEAAGHVEQILPVPFGEIADLTMTPVSHMLWSAMWIGIAGDALQRAKGFFRPGARASRRAAALGRARGRGGQPAADDGRPPEMALAHQRQRRSGQSTQGAFALAAEMNGLKTAVSTMALQVVQQAMLVCGMAGYKHGTPFSLGATCATCGRRR